MCEESFKRQPGETEAQKQTRKYELMVCRLAAIAHPNRKGAAVYAESIKEQVEVFVRNPGWLRSPVASPASQ
jgi:hypothetical protein